MPRSRRSATLGRLIGLAAVATLAGSLLSAAAAAPAERAAAPRLEVDPVDLARGADPAVPYVEDSDLVVGERRISFDAPRVRYLGRSGQAHLVATTDDRGDRQRRVWRVRPDDSTKLLVRGADAYTVEVSADGKRVVYAKPGNRSTRVRVWSARTGRLRADMRFDGFVEVLGAAGTRVLVRGENRGARWWNTADDTETLLTDRIAYLADPATNRLASYSRDPFSGGCTVVSRLDRPGQQLWRSCKERVAAFSLDGRQVATIPLLSDGIGPADVVQRTVGGSRLAHYTTRWFGDVGWESNGTLLLEANGIGGESALVRCTPAGCENATDPRPVEEPRPLPVALRPLAVGR